MGIKDTRVKEFLSDNRRFADLCNFFIFGGQQKIAPEDLHEMDSVCALNVPTDEGYISLKKQRDLLKHVVIKCTKKCTYAIIVIENQSEIHYAMPVRNMLYDVMNYTAQVEELRKLHINNGDLKNSSEFLSGLTADDRLTPVITLTLYLGSKTWDGPRSIHDMLDRSYSAILDFVADYKINLIQPGRIDDFSQFKTSLGEVLHVMKLLEDKQEMEKLLQTDPAFKRMDRETAEMISTYAGLKLESNLEEDDKVDMCKAWADQRMEGVEEGRKQGMAEGLVSGELLNQIKMVVNKIKKGKTPEETVDALELKPDMVQKIYDIAGKMAPDYDVDEIMKKMA